MRVLRQVQLDGKWEMAVVPKSDGGAGHDWHLLTFKGKTFPTLPGTFYLQYVDRTGEKPRKVTPSIGATVREAKAALATQSLVLEVRASGGQAEDAPEIQERRPATGKRVADVVDAFVKAPPIKLRDKSVAKYSEALKAFKAWSTVRYVTQLERQDILDFMAYLVREKKLAMGTAIDKAVIVLNTMRGAGADIQLRKGDWPKVTEKQPEIYTPDLLQPLFRAMKPAEYALFQTFLLTGFRFQEVAYLAWGDLNVKACTLRVSKKVGYKFDPKNYKERVIPVPKRLVNLLKMHKAKQPEGEYFIFATSSHNRGRGYEGGQRDRHMLQKLKQVALRAGVNCGCCHSTWLNKPANCGSAPICRLWTLHKFRHTYATLMLRTPDIDIVSVQHLLGHSDIKSTMKYVRPLEMAELARRIEGGSLAMMYV